MYNNNNRGFFIPFAIGGLAGTALGYGLSNNNYNKYNYPMYYPYPRPYMYGPVYRPPYFY